jgi:hypothetical protein
MEDLLAQTYYKNEHCQIKFDQKNSFLVGTWEKPLTSEKFREGLDKMITAFSFFKTGRAIVDITHIVDFYLGDCYWFIHDWYPRATHMGHTHLALIVPTDVFIQINVEKILYRLPIQKGSFYSISSAVEWMIYH